MKSRFQFVSAVAMLTMALIGCDKPARSVSGSTSDGNMDNRSSQRSEDKSGERPDLLMLLKAVNENDIRLAQLLLERGADPNGKNPQGETPLVVAAIHGNTKMLGLLVKAGADLELMAKRDTTPLFAAIAAGKLDAVRWLLDAGANLEASTPKGVTPLMLAVL